MKTRRVRFTFDFEFDEEICSDPMMMRIAPFAALKSLHGKFTKLGIVGYRFVDHRFMPRPRSKR